MLWQIVLCAVVLWLVFDHFYRMYRHRNLSSIPYMPTACLPFIGHARIFLGNDENRMIAFKMIAILSNKLGGVVRFWFARRLFLCVTDAEQAEELLKVFLSKDDIMSILRDITGTGSIFAPVSIWRPRRKLLMPAFSPRNLRQFQSIFTKNSDAIIQILRQDSDGTSKQLWSYLNAYSLDSASISSLGVDLKVHKNPDQPFLKAFEHASREMADRVCQPWLQVNWIYQLLPRSKWFRKSRDIVFDFVNEIIKARRIKRKQEYENTIEADRDPNCKPFSLRSFLDIMLDLAEETGGISNEFLRDECIVIAIAGTDTSAVGMGFALSLLARHPEVQDKAFEEIKTVFGDSKRPITSQDLLGLNYIDAVLRESLRLYPPVPVIVRKVDSREKLSTLPSLVPGMGILINIWGVHRNPKYWGEDADKFRPERFLETTLRHPAAFMPFSNGPRNCIGYQYAMMSMKTMIANILRHYHISMPPCFIHKTSESGSICDQCKSEPMKITFDIMMKDYHKFNLKLEPRI